MSWLIIKNKCGNDYVSPGLLAIEMTDEFRELLKSLAGAFSRHHLADGVKYIGFDIAKFSPIYLNDQLDAEWRDLTEFLMGDIVEDWIIISDLPSGLPLLEDAVVSVMQVDNVGGVSFIGYMDYCDGDEIYTMAISIDDLLGKEPVDINWEEYKGD